MYLYRHIRTDLNQPFYIGVGSDSKGKYYRAHQKTNRNKEWVEVVEKANYEVEIVLDNLTKEEAYKSEKYFISYYKRLKYNGILVNISSGGQMGKSGVKDSEETKLKKSLASIGKSKTLQWKISQSISRKGKKRGKLPWLENNLERNKKISLSKKGKPSYKKTPITQYSKKGEFIQDFPSITEASSILNLSLNGINNMLKNKTKTSGGFVWKYNLI